MLILLCGCLGTVQSIIYTNIGIGHSVGRQGKLLTCQLTIILLLFKGQWYKLIGYCVRM